MSIGRSPAPGRALLDRWARFSHRHKWWLLAAWVLILATALVSSSLWGGTMSNNFRLPGSEAQAAYDLLEERFPARAGDRATLVFEAEQGVQDPAIRQRVDALLAEVSAIGEVVAVANPYEEPGAISRDGTIARAEVQFEKIVGDSNLDDITRMVTLADEANGDGLRVEAGGEIVQFSEEQHFGSEAIGLMAAVVILLIAFGSVIAMGLPIGAAIFGLGCGFAVITLSARVFDFPDFSPQFAAMIGIGVGIDYSLLVVTRYREGLHSGKSVEDSIVLALTTSGRAVIFAGLVVAISFLGLYAMGLPFVAALGTAGAIVVILAVLVALTLMPALLSIAGASVDRLKVPFLHSTEGVDTSSGWYRLSNAIQRRPLPYFFGATALLLILAAPVLSMRLGFTDAGNSSEDFHSRRAYDLLAKGFGPGYNGPLLGVADISAGGAETLEAIGARISATTGVVYVTPPMVNPEGNTAVFTIIPTTSPQDESTDRLVKELRDEVLPAALEGTPVEFYVGGRTASGIDVGDRITGRMPYLFGGVIGLSFLLLMVVFRSILIPLKAAIVNLLSIGAAYGVIVAVFQWGWLGGVIGVGEGPIEVFLPMMLFAILFGLSMDYEVFLISRIREEYIRTGSNAVAVSNGLTATARVITAAAAIMVSVFLAFVLGPERVIKEFGIGLATAIFVDATIVRLILVPATMELLGDRNWWLPRWLDRLLPHVNVEGSVPTSVDRHGVPAPAGGD